MSEVENILREALLAYAKRYGPLTDPHPRSPRPVDWMLPAFQSKTKAEAANQPEAPSGIQSSE
ncbi:hypothetical protein [Roseivivax halotolerans]|uniref:hypothetical protein n=1 Tax=Roseivivax halotolerans TaxID=93684 RepID=UPI001113B878|nr:hypothetical protein [Roseivivax halotolerans]